MAKEQFIFVCFELNTEAVRATKDQWCKSQSNDVVINSVLSESGICNANSALEDPQFFGDQERVRNVLVSYIDALQRTDPKSAEILKAYAPLIFEHNLHELHKWAYTLKKIINASLFKVKVMFPCTYGENHLFLFEAEGETSATWIRSILYKRTDFLTQLLKKFVIELGIDHGVYGTSVTIFSRWDYHARRITRTFGMTIARGMLHFKNAVRHHRNNPSPSMVQESQLLVIVRSVIHVEYFSNLLKDQRTTCLVQDGLGVYPRVLQRAKIEGASNIVHCYDLVKPLQVLKSTLQLLGEIFKFTIHARHDSRSYVFVLDGMSINMTTLLKECMVMSLDTKILRTAISSIASKANFRLKAVAHSELFTAYPHAIKQICDNFKIPTYQFAFATYEMRPVPDFIHADRFFCFSFNQLESILNLANTFDSTCVCYVGNLLIESSNNSYTNKVNNTEAAPKNVILYYSQPFNDEADEALISVKRITDAMDLSLKVVMHPRERVEKFVKYGDGLCILTNEMYIEQRTALFNKTLFAITRNSNVGYQLLLRDIPLVNYLTTAKDELVKHEYYNDYPLIARSEDQMTRFLASPNEYIEKYKIFRNLYIERAFHHKGVNDVIATILTANDVT